MPPKPKRIENRALLDLFHAMPCVVCNTRPSDPCHIKSKGSGGDDVLHNLIALCREHHSMQHQIGWRKFIRLYPVVFFFLKAKGWWLTDIGSLERINSDL